MNPQPGDTWTLAGYDPVVIDRVTGTEVFLTNGKSCSLAEYATYAQRSLAKGAKLTRSSEKSLSVGQFELDGELFDV